MTRPRQLQILDESPDFLMSIIGESMDDECWTPRGTMASFCVRWSASSSRSERVKRKPVATNVTSSGPSTNEMAHAVRLLVCGSKLHRPTVTAIAPRRIHHARDAMRYRTRRDPDRIHKACGVERKDRQAVPLRDCEARRKSPEDQPRPENAKSV